MKAQQAAGDGARAGLSAQDQQTAAPAGVEGVSGQNRHNNPLCHRQDRFAFGDGQQVGIGAFGSCACC